MTFKKTEIKMTKPFWCIVRSGDVNGYHTGVKSMETALYEFDSATEMENFLENGFADAGESMGDYFFKNIAMSHDSRTFNQIIESEKQE